jgi:hypothetical protein
MKITVESTTKIVDLFIDGAKIPARIWEGATDNGTPVHVFITRIAPTVPLPLSDQIEREFGLELQECRPPSAVIAAIPLRLIL